jgi:hypothetical protein
LTTTDRHDLIDAVLRSRDEIDPDLETDLLEAIVDAEAESAGDGDAAMRAIDAAVTAAIKRGVGKRDEPEIATGGNADSNGEGDQA